MEQEPRLWYSWAWGLDQAMQDAEPVNFFNPSQTLRVHQPAWSGPLIGIQLQESLLVSVHRLRSKTSNPLNQRLDEKTKLVCFLYHANCLHGGLGAQRDHGVQDFISYVDLGAVSHCLSSKQCTF